MTRLLAQLGGRRFKSILADPPWAFRAFGGQDVLPSRSATPHYSTMSHEQLRDLPVDMVAAQDAVLHLWTVDSHLDQGMELGRAWGFEFKTIGFIWVKTQKSAPTKPKMSLGHWTRKEAEVCLLFTKGRPKRLSRGVEQVIMEPAREHSRKPDCARERIEQLAGGPYLELFGRSTRAGWTSWGNQTGLFD